MSKQPIRIKRWKIVIRRLTDELRAYVYKAFSWLTPNGHRNRRALKINLLKSSGTGHREAGGGEVIRISPGPATTLEPPVEEIVLPPFPPTRSGPRATKAHEPESRNINVTDGVRLCAACGEPLTGAELKATCQSDPHHIVHRKCLRLMKHKCPHCGGRLA